APRRPLGPRPGLRRFLPDAPRQQRVPLRRVIHENPRPLIARSLALRDEPPRVPALLPPGDRLAPPRLSARRAAGDRRRGRAPAWPGAGAKSVMALFQRGGESQMALFAPKRELSRYHGKPYPGKLEIHFDKQAGPLLESPFRFRSHGQSGLVFSELLPHTA